MNRLEELRHKRMISVTDLCKVLGISWRTYNFYRSGRWPIPSNILVKLSEYYGCSVDYILGIKNYTHITVADNEGVVLADIGHNEIIEHNDIKVILS